MRVSFSCPEKQSETFPHMWFHNGQTAMAALHEESSTLTGNPAQTDPSALPRVVTLRPGQGVKTVLDMAVAGFLLLLAFPVFAVIWCLVRLDGGPGFYGHPRIGRNGKTFGCLKFRTMVTNSAEALEQHLANNPAAAAEWEASRKLTHDPRITPIGRFLRKTSLDELPQLLNVLRREMSLVGPRPVVQDELKYYGDRVRYYKAVRPGITGLWQISGRSDTTYEQRVSLDTEYVLKWNLLLDLYILACTLPAVLTQKGAR